MAKSEKLLIEKKSETTDVVFNLEDGKVLARPGTQLPCSATSLCRFGAASAKESAR